MQPELGFGLFDYQARFYQADLGRFINVDPASEMFFGHSAYNYSFNNPINFIDRDGMVPEQSGGTDPDPIKLFGKRIDMTNATGSARNAAGHPRNGPWFWRRMLEKYPEMFSEENRTRISSRSGTAPKIDDRWIKHNPTHADYKGGKLVHHHIDQGKFATGIPEEAHKKFFSDLHKNRGGRPRGAGRSGKIGGALGLAAFALDIINSFRGDPHSLGMQFTVGSRLNTIYFDRDTEQYFEITNREDITNEDGEVIGQRATYTTYESYSYDREAGKYVGVGETGTHAVERYEGEDAKIYFRQLRGL